MELNGTSRQDPPQNGEGGLYVKSLMGRRETHSTETDTIGFCPSPNCPEFDETVRFPN